MTVGEGVAVGVGLIALAVGGYAFVQSGKEDASAQAARLNAQLAAQLAAQQRQPASTGNKAVDTGLAILNGLGGVPGLFKLVDEFTD